MADLELIVGEGATKPWSTATGSEILADIREAKHRMFEERAPFVTGCPVCYHPVYSTDTECWSCDTHLPWAT